MFSWRILDSTDFLRDKQKSDIFEEKARNQYYCNVQVSIQATFEWMWAKEIAETLVSYLNSSFDLWIWNLFWNWWYK